MSAEKIVRTQARSTLKENGLVKALIGLGMLATFYMIIEGVAFTETYIVNVFKLSDTLEFIVSVGIRSITTLLVILLCPAVLGYLKMMYTDKKEYEMSEVVYYFSKFRLYSRSVAFIFSYILRMFLPALLFFLPVFILIGLNFYTKVPAFEVLLWILCILSTVGLVVYSLKYFVSIKLFCDEDLSVKECFKTSKKMMDGNSKNVIRLFLSFTPWILLCITVLPLLYVVPYITQAMCISGKWIIELSRNDNENELF